jgi:hypothetical protein
MFYSLDKTTLFLCFKNSNSRKSLDRHNYLQVPRNTSAIWKNERHGKFRQFLESRLMIQAAAEAHNLAIYKAETALTQDLHLQYHQINVDRCYLMR